MYVWNPKNQYIVVLLLPIFTTLEQEEMIKASNFQGEMVETFLK